MLFLAWDLSQMPPGKSFEMTQEKPVSLILKLRRANNFVINVIVYSEYDSEVEILNNRKVICHEFALKSMQKVTEISKPHNQSASFSNEYNNRKINIDFNEILHSEINDSLARNKKYEIQIECVTEIHMVIPNTHYASPYCIHHVPKHK